MDYMINDLSGLELRPLLMFSDLREESCAWDHMVYTVQVFVLKTITQRSKMSTMVC
jgi:hypothetical protein